MNPSGSQTGHGGPWDVAGVGVGHAQKSTKGWLTGTTVITAPPGTVGSVEVRGGAPGTRETDLLAPENLISTVDAVCLTGGSAYGLAAADGVMACLERHGRGVSVGAEAHQVVPIVPAAVIFDLGRGGSFGSRPDAGFGRDATSRALAHASGRPTREGSLGAGTGAWSAGLRGGSAGASVRVQDHVVAAWAVVNSVGSVMDPSTGLPWDAGSVERLGLRRPPASQRRRLTEYVTRPSGPTLNTTIGLVVTSARLDKASCRRLAGAGHDGLARAIRPAHLWRDGDTVFSWATGASGEASTLEDRDRLLAAAADAFALACTRAVLLASSRSNSPPAVRDIVPDIFGSTD